MTKLMLISFSGLSDHDANGMTMKAVLSAFRPAELCQFYSGTQTPDFTAAHSYFRVTDVQMIKSFLGKKYQREFYYENDPAPEKSSGTVQQHKTKALPGFLKKRNQNFAFRMTRELLWSISPWGRKKLLAWAEKEKPDALIYMVGESVVTDRLVLRLAKKLSVPLVLYNCEAYRLVDTKKRKGLDKIHHNRMKRTYRKLNERAGLTIFNCPYLKACYEKAYPVGKSMLAYNSGDLDNPDYKPGDTVRLAYFGNLGIGRTDALLDVAKTLEVLDPKLFMDVYGSARGGEDEKLRQAANVRFHGFVDQEKLRQVKNEADILLHAESFDPAIIPKLEYAFSTKIAQCLCAGRSFLSYAPGELASTQYLLGEGCAVVATSKKELEEKLRELISNRELRVRYARLAKQTAQKNHCRQTMAQQVRQQIEAIIHES